jgi:nitrogen fixation/metabolism regulation signal transduction histidine kinase
MFPSHQRPLQGSEMQGAVTNLMKISASKEVTVSIKSCFSTLATSIIRKSFNSLSRTHMHYDFRTKASSANCFIKMECTRNLNKTKPSLFLQLLSNHTSKKKGKQAFPSYEPNQIVNALQMTNMSIKIHLHNFDELVTCRDKFLYSLKIIKNNKQNLN